MLAGRTEITMQHGPHYLTFGPPGASRMSKVFSRKAAKARSKFFTEKADVRFPPWWGT
jgi:hypothetical protein